MACGGCKVKSLQLKLKDDVLDWLGGGGWLIVELSLKMRNTHWGRWKALWWKANVPCYWG